jgi:hypothetical protein
MKCWADCLGDCNSKQSREHVISKVLFPGSTVTVQGFSWCKNEPKEIGIANLTAKILCKPHNTALSPVDKSAGTAFEALREVTRLKNVREAMKPHRWNVKTYSLDGVMVERWFLKTLINLAVDGDYPIGADSSVPGWPSDRLVRIAFGSEQFRGKAGMYTVSRVGMEVTLEDRVSFSPVMGSGRQVMAGLFIFRGFTFLLYLEPEGPQDMRGIFFKGEHLVNTTLLFQKVTWNFKVGQYLSHVVKVTY